MKTKSGLTAFLLAALLFAGLRSSSAYVAVSIGIAPPAIPVYEQPYCPGPGYIWTPGYWAYSDFGYYWVPGEWVLAPRVGFLWTPGYWGFRNGGYYFNQGYWGPTIGFYGGINYGYGYYGSGYYGGRWVGNTFSYNTAVSRVNTNVITNTYVNREVVKNVNGPRASFNGPGGVKARATVREQAAAKAEHIGPTSAQRSRVEAAKNDPELRAKNNKGKPKAAAVNSFESKNRPARSETAAASKAERANKQPGEKNGAENRGAAAKNRTATGNHAALNKHGEKTSDRTAKATDRSRSTARTARNQEAASHARKAPEAKRHEPVKAASAPRAVRHPQAAPQRTQQVSHRQAAPRHQQAAQPRKAAPGRGEPGPAKEEGKKKKKRGQGDR